MGDIQINDKIFSGLT